MSDEKGRAMRQANNIIDKLRAERDAAREKLEAIEARVGPAGMAILERARGAEPPLVRIERLEAERDAVREEAERLRSVIDGLQGIVGWIWHLLHAPEHYPVIEQVEQGRPDIYRAAVAIHTQRLLIATEAMTDDDIGYVIDGVIERLEAAPDAATEEDAP